MKMNRSTIMTSRSRTAASRTIGLILFLGCMTVSLAGQVSENERRYFRVGELQSFI